MKSTDIVLYKTKAPVNLKFLPNMMTGASFIIPGAIILSTGSFTSGILAYVAAIGASYVLSVLHETKMHDNLVEEAFINQMPESKQKQSIISYPALYQHERSIYVKSQFNKYSLEKGFRAFFKRIFTGKATYASQEVIVGENGERTRKIIESTSKGLVFLERAENTETGFLENTGKVELEMWKDAVANAYNLDPSFNLNEAKRESSINKRKTQIAEIHRQVERQQEYEKLASIARIIEIIIQREKEKHQFELELMEKNMQIERLLVAQQEAALKYPQDSRLNKIALLKKDLQKKSMKEIYEIQESVKRVQSKKKLLQKNSDYYKAAQDWALNANNDESYQFYLNEYNNAQIQLSKYDVKISELTVILDSYESSKKKNPEEYYHLTEFVPF